MSIKDTQKIRQKNIDELKKDAQKLREDIAKTMIDRTMAPQKDTNVIGKMKRTLAVTLTVIAEKQSE
jgi:ribosomal protein L29